MIKQVILIGGHIQALGLARQAAAIGINVVLFIEDAYSVARFSRAVAKTIVFKKVDNLITMLVPYQNTDTVLFPTADVYVEFLSKNEKKLCEHFQLGIPDQRSIEIFSNKRNAYNYIEQIGVPQPLSWLPNSIEDIKNIANNLNYPIVIKPAIMHGFHKMFGKKAFRCNTKKILIERCRNISAQFPIKGLLLQEFISGGPKDLYSYGVFAVEGKPKAWIIANRIRQNPMDFGNSTTFAITCEIPEIELSAKKILSAINYTGLAEIEFMFDEKTRKYKFLEINTRAWKWHSISMALGFGFLSEWLNYLNNEDSEFIHSKNTVAWCERLTDFAVIAKEKIHGRISIGKVISLYKIRKQNAVWSIKDPLPAIMYLLLSPLLFIKRH